MKTIQIALKTSKASITTLRAVAKAVDSRADINIIQGTIGKANLYQYVNGRFEGKPKLPKKLLKDILVENEENGIFLEWVGYNDVIYTHKNGEWIKK